jgi:hypothetical protein
MQNKFFSFLIFFIAISLQLIAQETTPYSRYGLGIAIENNFIPSQSMGGLNAAYKSIEGVNYNNPASYTEDSITSFEAGGVGTLSKITDGITKQKIGSFQPSYLAISFPIKKYWGMSTGLVPLFHKDYIIKDTTILNDDYKIRKEYDGVGDIYNFYWGNGFKFKDFSAGLNIGYMFGKISNYSLAYNLLGDFIDNSSYATFINKNLRVKSFTYNMGAAYLVKLDKGKQAEKPIYLNFAVSGYPKYKLGKQSTLTDKVYTLETYLLSNRGNNQDLEDFNKEILQFGSAGIDTFVNIENQQVKVVVPGKINFGMTVYDKTHYNIGFDIGYQPWSRYSGYESNDASVLSNSIRFAAGGEFAASIIYSSNFFKRLKYRAGFNYTKTNITINDLAIKEFGINFGLGIPIVIAISDENGYLQRNMVYAFHLGMEAGSRGTTNKNLLKENFVRLKLGINFNDRWFVKRKYF